MSIQIFNEIKKGIQVQQIVVQQQPQQLGQITMTTTTQPNVQQHINIQPKPTAVGQHQHQQQQPQQQTQQLQTSQQSSHAMVVDSRPTMTMVSLAPNSGNSITISNGTPLVTQSPQQQHLMQSPTQNNMTTPLTSPPHVPLLPPPNPLVAMTTLSAGPFNTALAASAALMQQKEERKAEQALQQQPMKVDATSEATTISSASPAVSGVIGIVSSTPSSTTMSSVSSTGTNPINNETKSDVVNKNETVTPMDTTPAKGNFIHVFLPSDYSYKIVDKCTSTVFNFYMLCLHSCPFLVLSKKEKIV